jgi:thioredoxin reductase (NADPH)
MADKAEETTHDVIIVGAGIAGLSAAIYTTRERLSTLVLEKLYPGGQILTTARVENYPGFPEAIGGMELADRLSGQAKRFGAEIVTSTEVTRLEPCDDGGCRSLDVFADDTRYRTRAVILGVGSEYRKLNCPGEKRLTGYGVSYCGTCDAPFYEDKHVVVVGGGNTALDEGLHLLKYASRLTYVMLRDDFTGERILIDELRQHEDRVRTCFKSTVTEILGEERVEAVRIKHTESGEEEELACDGVFVFIGLQPLTGFLKGTVDLDDGGFILTDGCTLETSLTGVWAAGDARAGAVKQAATAAGEGVVAALNAKEYLRNRYGVGTRS